MPIFETDFGKVLFIHVPKTGGTTIEEHVSKTCPISLKDSRPDPSARCKSQHYHGKILERILRDVPLHYRFMVVRHPVDRIRSEYLFQTRKAWKFHRRISFSAWLRYHLRRSRSDPFHRDNHFRPQHEFEACAAEVFRFEEGLDACFQRLEAVAGVPRPVGDIHLKRSRPARIEFRQADLDVIGAFYREDLQRYGYELNAPFN